MNRNVVALFALLVLAALICSPALAWGSATHAYIADRIGARLEPFNMAEMYGSMAPDMFQLDLNLAFDPLLGYYTHGARGQGGFMAIWNEARGPMEKAFACGWVGHNNVWGADFKAHDPLTGYIIQKAAALDQALATAGVWAQVESQLGSLSLDDRLLFCHIVVETDGDIVLRKAAPRLNEQVIGAALLRLPNVSRLLVNAMQGADPAVVKRMEARFRQYMVLYGAVLTQDDETAITMMAADVARQALAYLVFVHPEFPIEQARGPVGELSLVAMQQAFPLLDDYVPAVTDTIQFVSAELADHHLPCGRRGGGDPNH